MLSRRRFLLLLGGATAGMWLASTGLVTLDRRFVLQLGGACSFCGVPAHERRTLTGVAGRAPRICDECVGLCCDILTEEGVPIEPPPPPVLSAEVLRAREQPTNETMQHYMELSAQISAAAKRGDYGAIRQLAEEFAGKRHSLGSVPEFQCSFCDASRKDVRKLVSGPRVFICDDCVVDAAGTVTRILKA
jgi:ClpX C4-type zinc finger